VAPRKNTSPQNLPTSHRPLAPRTPIAPNSSHLVERAAQLPQSLTAHDMLALQRTVGNRAVSAFATTLPKKTVQRKVSETVMGKMEEAFQRDFSDVTLHPDSSEAVAVGAQALTRGDEIHFAPGAYQPAGEKGQQLLGHELTHVVQQRTGMVRATETVAGQPINDSPALEAQAQAGGIRAARGEAVGIGGAESGAPATPVQQHFIEYATVVALASMLGVGSGTLLGLVGTFSLVAIYYGLKSCLSRGAKNVEIEDLKAEILKVKESQSEEELLKGSTSEAKDSESKVLPQLPSESTSEVKSPESKSLPQLPLESASEVKDSESKVLPQLPSESTSEVKSPESKVIPQLPLESASEAKTPENKVNPQLPLESASGAKTPESTESPSTSLPEIKAEKSLPNSSKSNNRGRQQGSRKKAPRKQERSASPVTYSEPTYEPVALKLSKSLQSKLKYLEGIEESDVAEWQKSGGLPDSAMAVLLNMNVGKVQEILNHPASLFVGHMATDETIQEQLESIKVQKLNSDKKAQALLVPKDKPKSPGLVALNQRYIGDDDANPFLAREGEQSVITWLSITPNDTLVRDMINAANKTGKSIAELDQLLVNHNPHGYGADVLLSQVMSHGYATVLQALQGTAVENSLKYLELWLAYGVTGNGPLQKLTRFQARFLTVGAQLAVFQDDVEYVNSYDPPSRTGFLDYNFGGQRIVIHTHWNINAKRLVSMHVQDTGINGIELQTWNWFKDIAKEVKEAHNRASGTFIPTTNPTGGKLTL
jgi:hypothetical protein